jgi:hypothetical protein
MGRMKYGYAHQHRRFSASFELKGWVPLGCDLNRMQTAEKLRTSAPPIVMSLLARVERPRPDQTGRRAPLDLASHRTFRAALVAFQNRRTTRPAKLRSPDSEVPAQFMHDSINVGSTQMRGRTATGSADKARFLLMLALGPANI